MAEIKVYDAGGNPRSLDWLRGKYGPFVIYDPPPLEEGEEDYVWRITTLRERVKAPATLIFKVIDEEGNPIPDLKVAWYWPDVKHDPDCGPMGAPFEGVNAGRAEFGTTNANGEFGAAMGGGAYYNPAIGEKGPHAGWGYGSGTRSQLILGLGMVTLTNHDHFDVEYTQFFEKGGENGGEEGDFNFWMDKVVKELSRIADALED